MKQVETALYLSLYERQGFSRVVDQDIVYGLAANSPLSHSRHDVTQDVIVSVATVLFQAVLGADIMGDQDFATVSFRRYPSNIGEI